MIEENAEEVKEKEGYETNGSSHQFISLVSDAFRMQRVIDKGDNQNEMTIENKSNCIWDDDINQPLTQRQKIEEIMTSEYININIGGTVFSLSFNVFRQYSNSIIYKDFKEKRMPLYYDRDPLLFQYVIEILRAQSLLFGHKSLDPRKLQQIINELSHYRFITDLPKVIDCINNKTIPIEETGWFILNNHQSSFELLSTKPSRFKCNSDQCHSFIIFKKTLINQFLTFQFTLDSSITHQSFYIGLINKKYSEGIHDCICKSPLNSYCLISNGTIGINGEKYYPHGLVYSRLGTQYTIIVDLTKEYNKTIVFTQNNIDNPSSFNVNDTEFYFVIGVCKGDGSFSITYN